MNCLDNISSAIIFNSKMQPLINLYNSFAIALLISHFSVIYSIDSSLLMSLIFIGGFFARDQALRAKIRITICKSDIPLKAKNRTHTYTLSFLKQLLH